MLFDEPERRSPARIVLDTTRLVPFERHRSAVRWQFALGVLIGVLASAAVAIPAFHYAKTRQEATFLQKASGQTTLAPSDSATASQGTKEAPAGSSALSTPPKTQSPKPPNHSANGPVEPATARERTKSSASFAASAPAPLTDASLKRSEPTKKTLATLAQLWASYEAGDAKAAVALADIYLRGEGVPVNCEQARVILLAASKQNSAEATRKLRDLDATGCPASSP